MKKAMARRLRRVEEGLRRQKLISHGDSAKRVLAQRITQMSARTKIAGTILPSQAELQAYHAQWQAYLEGVLAAQGRVAGGDVAA